MARGTPLSGATSLLCLTKDTSATLWRRSSKRILFVGWVVPLAMTLWFRLYVHLVQSDHGERALHHFFLRLMTHLAFFRKISGIDLMNYFIRVISLLSKRFRDTNTI